MEEKIIEESFNFMGFVIKKEIAIGDLLTSLTILTSFIGWLIATIKQKKKDQREESKSGALRFLLKILRGNSEKEFTLNELKKEFESNKRKIERDAYCGKNFKFKDASDFESAIYRLDWEGKIDFLSGNKIKFRID